MIETHKTTVNPFFLSKAEQINLHVLAEIESGKVNRMKFNVFLKPQYVKPVYIEPIEKIEATLLNIMKEVTEYFNVTHNDLKNKSHKGNLVRPRKIFCVLANELTDHTLTEIGNEVNRDHSTVHSSHKALESYQYKIMDGDTTWNDYLKIKSMFK